MSSSPVASPSPSASAAGSSASSSSNPAISSPASHIRWDMVNAAKQFMANPRVRMTPLAGQKEFLRGKGLTEAEIEVAFDKTGTGGGGGAPGEQPSYDGHQIPNPMNQPSSSNGPNHMVFDFAKTALVLGSAGFMFYRFVRCWLLPQFFGVADPAEERMQRLEEQICRMGDSNRVIAESVAQTLATVTEQNEQISRTLLLIQGQAHYNKANDQQDRVLAELGIVKSLMLNQSQFPPIPQNALQRPIVQNGGIAAGGASTSAANGWLPSWQKATLENGHGHVKNGKEPGGVEKNGEENGENGEEEDEVDLDKSNESEV